MSFAIERLSSFLMALCIMEKCKKDVFVEVENGEVRQARGSLEVSETMYTMAKATTGMDRVTLKLTLAITLLLAITLNLTDR